MSASILALLTTICSANVMANEAMCPAPCPPAPPPCCNDQGPCCNSATFKAGGYTGISGGVNFLCTSGHKHNKPHASAGYELGWEIGYRWKQGIRLEFEAAYRHNHIDYVRHQGSNVRSGGHVWSGAAMVNGVFEFPGLMCFNCVKPYVGVGLGYTHIDIDIEGPFGYASGKDGFAWQVIAGIDYWFDQNVDIAVEYRYREGPITYFFDQTAQVALKYHF